MQAGPNVQLPPNSLDLVLAVALAVTLAAGVALVAGTITRRLLAAISGGDRHLPLTTATLRLVRFTVFWLSAIVLAIPALDFAGVDLGVGLTDQDVARWAVHTGVRLAVLVLLALAASRLAGAVIVRAEREVLEGSGRDQVERRKRAQTLANTLRRSLSALIWTTAALMIMRELDVDITPVLTGAGILGLAIGFGAQTLVKDIIAGVFIIVEDQVRVGDVAAINGVSGVVEQINLRTIVLRDVEGVVYTISSGDIRTVANRSKDFAYYVIDLGVDYDDDTDRVVEAMRDAAGELQQDPAYGPSILEPLEVLGVDDFAPSQVTLRVRIKTAPLKQWEVGRELRRRIKKALDARGIRIPSPQTTVTVKKQG